MQTRFARSIAILLHGQFICSSLKGRNDRNAGRKTYRKMIAEYSEEIYPYATFQLEESVPPGGDSRCNSAAPLQTFVYHDPRLSTADTLQLREVSSAVQFAFVVSPSLSTVRLSFVCSPSIEPMGKHTCAHSMHPPSTMNSRNGIISDKSS